MTNPQDLAASLRARVIDRIDTDRAINSSNVEEAILDGLLLNEAKTGRPSQIDYNEIFTTAAAIVRLMSDRPIVALSTPYEVIAAIDQNNRALQKQGWKL